MFRTDYAGGLDSEGPLGFKMVSDAAKQLETVLKAEGLDPSLYRRGQLDGLLPDETSSKSRTDISWISVQSPDSQREVILTEGINDSILKQNNIVTMNHSLPAIGKNMWLKKKSTDARTGMIAQTKYLEKPDGFDPRDKWIGDAVFSLVVQKALPGKSVGILPVASAVRGPTSAELEENPSWQGCKVYERSYLVEYAVCPRPVHPETLTLVVNKSFPEEAPELFKFLGVEPVKKAEPPPEPEREIKTFVPFDILPGLVAREFARHDPEKAAKQMFELAIARREGRIV